MELPAEKNLVVYLETGAFPINRKKVGYFAGAHGYTYLVGVEGKRKLRKDTPTTNGYYTGNNQKANTVVGVEDVMTLTLPRAKTELTGLLLGFKAILEELVKEENNFKNLCLITSKFVLGELLKIPPKDFSKETLKIGRKTELGKDEINLLKEIYELNQQIEKSKKHLIMLDFTGSVEGGLGNKEATKALEIAMAETVHTKHTKLILDFMTRKEYEDPETDFNKIITASRWYFETTDKEEFYKLNNGYRVYGFGRVEPDKAYHGKVTPDVTYSKLYTKEPSELLDKLFDHTSSHIDNENGYLLAGDLEFVNSKETRRLIDRLPGYNEDGNLVSPNTRRDKKMVLVELVNPVLLSYRVREFLDSVDIVFNSFIKKDENNKSGYLTFYDITDLIYNKKVNGKGVTKVNLVSEFKQATLNIETKVTHRNANKPVKIALGVGYDLPSRNALNSVEDPDVKVWVGVDDRNEQGLRYMSVVETNEFIYVHTTAAANLRVLSVSELKK